MSARRNRRRTSQRKALLGKIMDKMGRERHDMGGYTLPRDVPEAIVKALREDLQKKFAGVAVNFDPITFY